MKVVNKIMIGIAVLCLLLCGGILVFALNPDMTSSLAQKLYGNTVDMPPGTEETGEGQTSGNGNISVTDQEAQNLKETLGSGETGEGLSFSAEEYPYYQMLSENQQSVYRQIYANAQNLTEKFAPEKTVSASDVKTAFEAVIGDHPEMFWLETGYSSKYLANGQCVEIDLKYNGTADDLESAKQRFDAAAQNLITGAASLDSNYEKEKYVHDALASAVTYDLTADMNQSAYSALVNGKSVCAGYARAYQYLLQQLGIPCYYCTGYSGGDHAWNIVKLEDGYYNVDVTWDDAAAIRYDYFNKTDADFASTHVRQNLSVYLPACNGTAYRQENTTGADPGQQGDGTQEPEQPGSSLSDYINPDPQEPLRYPSGNTAGSAGNTTTAATPEPRADALTDLSSYYEDCRKQLTGLGSGDQHFDNVVPKSLWSTIEQSYHTGAYEQGYVVDVLKNLGMEYFAIQLQLVDIGDGYYRVYHNVVTY